MKSELLIPNLQAGELMTRKVHAVMVGDTLQQAFALMNDNGVAALPIVNSEEKCVGILSRSDLNEILFAEDERLSQLSAIEQLPSQWLAETLDTMDDQKVSEAMTYEVELVRESDSLPDICRKMAKRKIHHLPVVDEDDRLRGIISTFDIVAAIAAQS